MSDIRDITKYTEDYIHHDFENVMVKYRREKVLEVLRQYKPKSILEIGCGMDSVVNYYNDCEKFVVVEPSETFAQKASNDIKNLTPPPPSQLV